MIDLFVTGFFSFVIGAFFGIFLTALLVANRDDD